MYNQVISDDFSRLAGFVKGPSILQQYNFTIAVLGNQIKTPNDREQSALGRHSADTVTVILSMAALISQTGCPLETLDKRILPLSLGSDTTVFSVWAPLFSRSWRKGKKEVPSHAKPTNLPQKVSVSRFQGSKHFDYLGRDEIFSNPQEWYEGEIWPMAHSETWLWTLNKGHSFLFPVIFLRHLLNTSAPWVMLSG